MDSSPEESDDADMVEDDMTDNDTMEDDSEEDEEQDAKRPEEESIKQNYSEVDSILQWQEDNRGKRSFLVRAALLWYYGVCHFLPDCFS